MVIDSVESYKQFIIRDKHDKLSIKYTVFGIVLEKCVESYFLYIFIFIEVFQEDIPTVLLQQIISLSKKTSFEQLMVRTTSCIILILPIVSGTCLSSLVKLH